MGDTLFDKDNLGTHCRRETGFLEEDLSGFGLNTVALLFGEGGEGKDVRYGGKTDREVRKKCFAIRHSATRDSICNAMSFGVKHLVLFSHGLGRR